MFERKSHTVRFDILSRLAEWEERERERDKEREVGIFFNACLSIEHEVGNRFVFVALCIIVSEPAHYETLTCAKRFRSKNKTFLFNKKSKNCISFTYMSTFNILPLISSRQFAKSSRLFCNTNLLSLIYIYPL